MGRLWRNIVALNRHSPMPLYYQLAELLREHIRSGKLAPGAQIPPERTLSEQHGISRMTVRQALAYLEREGTLVVRHGLGTFVAAPKLTYDALHLLGFTEEVLRHGGTVVSRVLELGRVAAPPRIAADLRLAEEAAVIRLVRLRLANGAPMLLETTYLSADRCPGLEHEDLAAQSLYAVLEGRYGMRLTRASQSLEATVANDYEAELFGIAAGAPMLLLEGITWDALDQPVEAFKAVYRGDRFTFSFESERSDRSLDEHPPARRSLSIREIQQ
jgi:GntR family transcriptional regulator